MVVCGLSLLAIGLLVSAAFGQEAKSPGEISQDFLTARLASGDVEQRLDAVVQLRALFDAAPNSASPLTIARLADVLQRDVSPIIRALSARVLGNCCGQLAAPALIASLASEREIAVRKAIIYALARYRSPQITSTLISLLKDKAPEIRGAASFALAEIGDAISSEALLEILQKLQKEEDAFARSQAARALGKIGDHSAIEVLVKLLLHDKSQEVRREAAHALGSLANKQDTNVIEALREAILRSDPYLAGVAREALDKVNTRNP
jgi:HEAT repeat protein